MWLVKLTKRREASGRRELREKVQIKIEISVEGIEVKGERGDGRELGGQGNIEDEFNVFPLSKVLPIPTSELLLSKVSLFVEHPYFWLLGLRQSKKNSIWLLGIKYSVLFYPASTNAFSVGYSEDRILLFF